MQVLDVKACCTVTGGCHCELFYIEEIPDKRETKGRISRLFNTATAPDSLCTNETKGNLKEIMEDTIEPKLKKFLNNPNTLYLSCSDKDPVDISIFPNF